VQTVVGLASPAPPPSEPRPHRFFAVNLLSGDSPAWFPHETAPRGVALVLTFKISVIFLQLNFNQFYFLQFVFLAVLSFCLLSVLSFLAVKFFLPASGKILSTLSPGKFTFSFVFGSFIFYPLTGKYSVSVSRSAVRAFWFWQFYFTPTEPPHRC
jgi:hypothetical protein